MLYRSAMKYDDASWHAKGETTLEAGGTHIGILLTWFILHGQESSEFLKDFSEEISLLKGRKLSPSSFLLKTCDGKFSSDALSSDARITEEQYKEYIDEYQSALHYQYDSIYEIADSWEAYDTVAPLLADLFPQRNKTAEDF